MSSALLKFKPVEAGPQEMAVDAGAVGAAVEASPEPMAVVENGKLIYGNRSFAQFSAQFGEGVTHPGAVEADSGSIWRRTDFVVGGRSLSLMTLRRESRGVSGSDATHLETVGRLVGGVAHDFNNLLTGILLYCDLMKSKLTAANPVTLKIEEIRYAAEQGAGLIRELMTVGREEEGAPRWVSFNYAVREMVPLLRHMLGENIAVRVELSEGELRVGLSLAEAQQVILNLALNARDAMPEGGVVGLGTRGGECEGAEAGNLMDFVVSDSGAGMDAETAARIFEPFYTTKVLGRGTGMGLVTVKRIVEKAGGTVELDTTLGKGTRVTVRLPQVEAGDGERDDRLRRDAEESRRKPQRVESPPLRSRQVRSRRDKGRGTQASQSENRGEGV